MATRRTTDNAPDLSPFTIATLLAGWTSKEPPETSHHQGFEGGAIDLFEAGGHARLWRAHEAYLRATAARWGWKPTYRAPDGRMLFEAEAVAEGLYDGVSDR